MLSEEANERSINLAIRVGKLSGNTMLKAIRVILADKGKVKSFPDAEKVKRGRTTLKQLKGKNDDLTTIELKNPDLRLINRYMKKDRVEFAAAKDDKGKYTLYFKGKDAESVTHALSKYARTLVKRGKEMPSIGNTLAEAKEVALTVNKNRSKEKNRNKGGLER